MTSARATSRPKRPSPKSVEAADDRGAAPHVGDRRAALHAAVHARRRRRGWTPFAGPQLAAFLADGSVDVIGYGGAGGGGKTDLALGLALLRHRRSILYRRTIPQLAGVEERAREVYGRLPSARYNETAKRWRLTTRCGIDGRPAPPVRRLIQFGSMQREADREKWRGVPFDLRVFDEAQNFLESQVRFTMAWTRTSVPGQTVTDLFCFNPPASAEGLWLLDFFAPWVDPKHPRPAAPGEVRYYITTPDGKDEEVDSPLPIERDGRTYTPRSRTFFPARVIDNPVYLATGYLSVLDSLPEPLRSQMRDGDFTAGLEDDAWQVIPTAWVRAAIERGRGRQRPVDEAGTPLPLTALGVDVAAGGPDRTVIARLVGSLALPLLAYPGRQTPDGNAAAARVIEALEGAGRTRPGLPFAAIRPNIDVVGIGQGLVTALNAHQVRFNPVNAAAQSWATDRAGNLKFANLRAELHWALREALDPSLGASLALPDDRELLAELCAPRWSLTSSGVQIEPKEGIRQRLGRSPDKAEALMLALWSAPRAATGESPFTGGGGRT